MQDILTLNNISQKGLSRLSRNIFNVGEELDDPVGILVRSQNMKEMELPESLCAIARAGAGTNNIPIEACSERGIVVFNTPGANANAVRELTIAGLVLSARNIVPAAQWVQTELAGKGAAIAGLVERAKRSLSGPNLPAKSWASLVWVLLAYRSPTPPPRWVWKYSAMTPIFRWMLPGKCPNGCAIV